MMETQRTEPDSSVLRKFVIPEFIFGPGARSLAGRYAGNFGARKVLLVTDPGVREAGWAEEVIKSMEAADLPYAVFDSITPNPRSEEVMSGAEVYLDERCDVIVAVGGGSPIDCAKGIGIVTANRKHILDFEGVDRVVFPAPPLICIPTTGGTSADVSQFAIINNEHERVKIAIVSKAVVPDLALIDPETLITMPPYLSACTAFDALTHAIEAFVSIAHSPVTDVHALEAIRLLTANLEASMREPENIVFRSNIMLGSLHAGMAFSNSSLGAVHAMAHSLGGFLDLAHGECNAILLEHVIAFNFGAVAGRYQRVGEALGLNSEDRSPSETKLGILGEIRRLRRAVGIDQSLAKLGVRVTDISELSRKAMRDACMVTNPRRPSQRDIEVIYGEAL